MDSKILVDLVSFKMPYGKYKGETIDRLPMYYLEWFAREGFPKGKLGMLMATMLEIKLNGLDELLVPIRKNQSRS